MSDTWENDVHNNLVAQQESIASTMVTVQVSNVELLGLWGY